MTARPPQRLDQRVVLVTGGAGEVGRSIALYCAQEGASVVIADAGPERAFQVQNQIEAYGGEASVVEADLTDEDSVQTMIGDAIMAYGTLHGVVISAPFPGAGDALSTTVADWDRNLTGLVRSAWLVCKYGLPFLKNSGSGSVVAIARADASATAMRSLLPSTAYGGLLGLMRSLAIDYAVHGVRVNTICAGYIQTSETEKRIRSAPDPEAELRRIMGVHPLGRLGKPEDVARAATFLLSADSSFITGTTLTVDGGRSIVSQGHF